MERVLIEKNIPITLFYARNYIISNPFWNVKYSWHHGTLYSCSWKRLGL